MTNTEKANIQSEYEVKVFEMHQAVERIEL